MLRDISTEFFRPTPIMSVNIEGVINEDMDSFMSLAIESCLAMEKNTKRMTRFLYHPIQEDVIDGAMMFADIIREIIDNFLEFIKDMVKRWIFTFQTFTKSDIPIERYASQILAFNKPLDMKDFLHFRYTNIQEDIPSSGLHLRFLEEQEELYASLCKICGNKKKTQDIVDAMNRYYNSIKGSFRNEYIYKLRAEIVGANTEISKERFSEELYMLFRDGKSTPSTSDIRPDDIHEAFRRFKNSKIIENNIKEQQRNITASATRVKKEVRDIKLKDITDGAITADYKIEYVLNNILRLKCDQITEMCNTMLLAFGAKLDAAKAAVEQDKKVLYAVISAIIGARKE